MQGSDPTADETGSQHGSVLRCQRCRARGESSRIRRLQVNFEECVSLCSSEKCLYNAASSSLILRRKASEIPNQKKRRKKPCLESLGTVSNPASSNAALLWRNKDALCWLDSSLLLIVFCKSLRKCLDISPGESSLKHLSREFDRAQATFHATTGATAGGGVWSPGSRAGGDFEISTKADVCESATRNRTKDDAISNLEDSLDLLQFVEDDPPAEPGGGNFDGAPASPGTSRNPPVGEVPAACGPAGQRSATAADLSGPTADLEAAREILWGQVQPQLRCEKGSEDSPVFALPVLLGKNRHVEPHFRSSFRWQFCCTNCHLVEVTPLSSVLPSLQTLGKSLSIMSYTSHRPCPACRAPKQRNSLVIHSLPACPMFHFVDGLPPLKSWGQLDFRHGGHEYRLAAIIQYKKNPNHFVGWVKDNVRNLWLEGDDLKNPVVEWCREEPSFPPSQAHVLMWERQSGCWECVAQQGVAQGIVGAEKVDLRRLLQRRKNGFQEGAPWSEGSDGFKPASRHLEAYIPRREEEGEEEAITSAIGPPVDEPSATEPPATDPPADSRENVPHGRDAKQLEPPRGGKACKNRNGGENEGPPPRRGDLNSTGASSRGLLRDRNQAGVCFVDPRYTGKTRPEVILRSIPTQLATAAVGGRKPKRRTAVEKLVRKSPRRRTAVAAVGSSGPPRRRKSTGTGLAARFAVFSETLSTFAEYKEMVEEGRRGSRRPSSLADRRSYWSGSVSPACSPSGSSESSGLTDNPRNILDSPELDLLVEDFIDARRGSRDRIMPDIEHFLENL